MSAVADAYEARRRARAIPTDEIADRFDRTAELRTEDAYSDPALLYEAAASLDVGGPATPGQKAAARLVGEILKAAMHYARALHGEAGGRADAIAALLKHGYALEHDAAFEGELRRLVEDRMISEWEAAQGDEP